MCGNTQPLFLKDLWQIEEVYLDGGNDPIGACTIPRDEMNVAYDSQGEEHLIKDKPDLTPQLLKRVKEARLAFQQASKEAESQVSKESRSQVSKESESQVSQEAGTQASSEAGNQASQQAKAQVPSEGANQASQDAEGGNSNNDQVNLD